MTAPGSAIEEENAMWERAKDSRPTGEQRTSLAAIADTNAACTGPHHSAQKQSTRGVRAKGATGRQLLAGWLSWASHSRIPVRDTGFAPSAAGPQPDLERPDHGLSNAKSSFTNTHLRALSAPTIPQPFP